MRKKKILDWILEWNKKSPKKKTLFLHGPSGTGKTVTIEALATEMSMELVQSNASDYRTADAVQRFVGRASQYGTLSGKRRLILFDELDGITGSADRGGLRAITDVVKKTRSPIILTANNAYDKRFSTLRKYCHLVEFKQHNRWQVEKHLKKIYNHEDIEFEDISIKTIVERASGDLRSAVNDLQVLAQGKTKLTYHDVTSLAKRDRKQRIFNVLKGIFYAKTSLEAKRAINAAEIDHDMLFEWIYDNIPYQVKNPEELVTTLEMIALADIYRRRIRDTQNWTLMRYFIDFISAGIAASWCKRSVGWVPFRFPSRIMAMSRSRSERAILKGIGARIGRRCHISSDRAIRDVIPYLRVIFQESKDMKTGLTKWFEFDDSIIKFLSMKK